MRAWSWLLLLLLFSPVAVSAQEAQGPPLLEDPAGDVRAVAAGQDAGASPAAVDRVDLRAVHLVETPTHLEASFQVGAIEQDPSVVHGLFLNFEYAGMRYEVRASSSLGGTDYFAAFFRIDESTGRTNYVDNLEATVSTGTATIHVLVPRDLVVGADGAPLVPDRSLTDIGVISRGLSVYLISIEGEPATLTLRDDVDGTAELLLRHGVEQTGNARLWSETPFRSSNGEATTFVFQVEAQNVGEAADDFELALQGVPAKWDVQLPVERLHLEAGEQKRVPLVVRTPFAHAHGSLEQFLLSLTSVSGDGVGRVEMGVRYPLIPQPAGHHDTLWMHPVPGPTDPLSTSVDLLNEAISGSGSYYTDAVVMNAVESDERLQTGPVNGHVCDNGRNGTSPLAPTYCWRVYLDPGLDMGLDFDLGRLGAVEVPVQALVPTDGAVLGGTLYHLGSPETVEEVGYSYTTQEYTPVADVVGGDPVNIGLDETVLLSATVVPRPEADLVPYAPDAGLVLVLELETDRLDYALFGPHEEPALLPGGFLRLPLLEYSDPVDQVFSAADALRLEVVTEQERMLNPGDTAVFAVDVAHAGERGTFDARVVGGNVEWASLLGPTTFTLEGNETQRLSVRVTAPADAPDEAVADLVLEVASTSDLSVRGLLRLVAVVDTDAEHPDDAEQAAALAQNAGRNSPGPVAPLLLAAVALLALARRRGPDRR